MKQNTLPSIQGAPPRNRVFPAYPIAVQALIIDENDRYLLLSSPSRNGNNEWQVISGGLEADETVLEGVLREVSEEGGPHLRVRPLTVIHSQTFSFDTHIPFMVGIYYLLAYEGGEVVPGDDMRDADHRWWSLDEMKRDGIKFHPSTHMWMMERGVEMAKMLRKRPLSNTTLQPELK